METFLVLGSAFAFLGVALGAFGSHALGAKLPPERIATFETGIQDQMSHALAMFLILLVDAWEPMSGGPAFYVLSERGGAPLLFAAGRSFAAGIGLFTGSLYALADTGRRTGGTVTPFGGAGLLLVWAFLLLAIILK